MDLDTLVKNCNYIFITTPDDVISSVWENLKSFNLQDKNIFHMSGSISSSIFDGMDLFGARGYSLHPIFPISDKNSYMALSSAVFTIEGRDISLIEDFLTASKIRFFEINGASKAKYHAAAVFASNYLVSLAEISRNLLLECGIPEEEALNALFPLMEGSLRNIREKGVNGALTGPISRGDAGTLLKHLEVIDGFRDAYSSLGKTALNIAFRSGRLTEKKRDEILDILGGSL